MEALLISKRMDYYERTAEAFATKSWQKVQVYSMKKQKRSVEWIATEEAETNVLLRVLDDLLSDYAVAKCPLCQSASLRFYYHKWQPLSLNRGAMWIWCQSCRKWASMGNMGLLENVSYNDPMQNLTLSEFGKLPQNSDWIDYLNLLWEQSALPKYMRYEKETERAE